MPGVLQSMGSQRVRHDLVTKQQQQQHMYMYVYIILYNIMIICVCVCVQASLVAQW